MGRWSRKPHPGTRRKFPKAPRCCDSGLSRVATHSRHPVLSRWAHLPQPKLRQFGGAQHAGFAYLPQQADELLESQRHRQEEPHDAGFGTVQMASGQTHYLTGEVEPHWQLRDDFPRAHSAAGSKNHRSSNPTSGTPRAGNAIQLRSMGWLRRGAPPLDQAATRSQDQQHCLANWRYPLLMGK